MSNNKSNQEWEIEKVLIDNPMYSSLAAYFNTKAPQGRLGRVKFTDTDSVVICVMGYGKARLYLDVHVEKNGAINTMVFDFRDIFDKYITKTKEIVKEHGEDYEEFVFKVLRQANFDPKNVCLFSNYKGGIEDDEEKYPAFGISLVGYTNPKFNTFTPWAGVLDEVLNALDAVNGFVDKDKKNRLTKKDVDAAAIKFPVKGWIMIGLGYAAIVGGLALVIFNRSWPAFLRWIVAIILILLGSFFGPMIHLSVHSDKKNYYNNSGDLLKKFHRAEHKMFPTVKE